MRRILYFTLAIAFIFSVCAVPASAASYDLGTPKRFNNNGISDSFLASGYTYDGSDWESFNPFAPTGQVGYFYSSRYSNDSSFPFVEWSFGAPPLLYGDFSGYKDITGNTDTTKPIMTFYSTQTNFNALYFAGFYYDHLFLPSDGQYFKVDFSFVSQVRNIPDSSLLDLSHLCFLSDGSDYTTIVPCSTATLSIDRGYIYNFTFYFQMNSLSFESLEFSEDIRLNIRIPYYNENQLGQGFYIVSNVDIPTSYEILTIGGYTQELNDISNAVVKGFDDLDSILTDVDPGDSVIITQLEDKFDELDDTLNDYDDAMQPVFQMKELYTHPPVANIIQSNTSNLDTAEVKDFLSLPWIISAFSMIFAFCIIRLILFGTKEG